VWLLKHAKSTGKRAPFRDVSRRASKNKSARDRAIHGEKEKRDPPPSRDKGKEGKEIAKILNAQKETAGTAPISELSEKEEGRKKAGECLDPSRAMNGKRAVELSLNQRLTMILRGEGKTVYNRAWSRRA